MNSADTDKTISGISLSQWMKTKIADRHDFEQAIFSPPHEDDSFFFIPYSLSFEPSKNDKEIELDSRPSYTDQNLLSDSSADFKMKRSSTVPDAQFKAAVAEEESRGGLSMINNMLSGKLFGYMPAENKPEDFTYRNRQRRNSKSLPASPLSSPKIYRKNPYFTDPFARPDETFEPGRTGLILSILSQRKSLEDLVGKANVSNAADVNYNVSKLNSPQIPQHTPKYYSEPKPKPSELREMNFWSPVSM